MKRITRSMITAVLATLFAAVLAPAAPAQTRLNDKDLENMMKNLNQDAKRFEGTFSQAVGKSTIRKTSREKDAKNLVKNFKSQTESMLKQFQNTKKADSSLPLVLSSARQIEDLRKEISLGPSVDSQWAKIRTELDTISDQFGVAPH